MTDIVSSMSQLDKVLHLYVEVRAVDEKGRIDNNRSDLRMLQCPDVLPYSNRGHVLNTNHSPDFSPKMLHRPKALSQSLPPSSCSSRHTVNFQLPNQDEAGCLTSADSLYGSVGQLSENQSHRVPRSVLNGQNYNYNHSGAQHNWVPENSFSAVGRWSVPNSPASYRRFSDRHDADDETGTTSVVKYGYVKKASVNTGSQQLSLCQYDTDSFFPKDHNYLQKRNSDPGWHQDMNNCTFSNYHQVNKAQSSSNFYKKSTLEAVAKDATHRALREFGSPELQRRYESSRQNNNRTNLTRHQQLPLSWSSSPSLLYKSPVLPSRHSQTDVTPTMGQPGFTAHTPQHFLSTGASQTLSAHRFSPSLHQQRVEKKQAKTLPRSHLPAGKPTDIQHTIPLSNIHPNYSKKVSMCSNYGPNNFNSNANNSTFFSNSDQNLSHFNTYNASNDTKISDKSKLCTSTVPSMDQSVNCYSKNKHFSCENQPSVGHRWQNSPLYVQPHLQTDHRSSQIKTEYRSTQPKSQTSSKSLSLPSSLNHTDLLHHTEIQPQHDVISSTGLNRTNVHYPCTESRHHVSAKSVKSPEAIRRAMLDSHQTHCSSGSHLSKPHVYRREHSANVEQKCVNPIYSERKDMPPMRNRANCDIDESSKVSQSDVSCRLGPHTSSKTRSKKSHVLRQPDLRSEKIAKAKWDFLFGTPSEECCFTKGGSVAPSHSPQDTVGQRLLHHKVQEIEVELFRPDPCGSDSGIIRRTLKYSETDLDAVPLRCYRETDLDQVMQAEGDVFEENETKKAASGSDCSVLEASSFSPENVNTKNNFHDQEATVGSNGIGEKDIKTSREFIRHLDMATDTHCPLKSPVSLSSPRCSSDGNLDSFSRHFENIMESHRAKGTSYSSLDSVDVLTTGSSSVFTFDLPTLTPEIQTQISDTARHLIDLSFAPLSRSLRPGASVTPASEISSSASNKTQTQSSPSKDSTSKDVFKKVSSAPSLHTCLKEHVKRPPELLYPQADVAQRLAHADSIDALNGFKPDLQAAKRLAQRLYSLDGFKKSDVARHLNKNNEFSHCVAEEYLSLFNFSGLTIDQALRSFLRRLALVGETQERERLLTHFSHRYTQCNPHCLNTEDSVHTLTCAVMLLNSDLHGNNLGKRMSCNQFISNLEGLNDGKDFPKELLKTLYTSIRSEKLQWTIDEEEVQKPGTTMAPDARKDSASHTLKRQGPSGNSLLSMTQANEQLYKSGLLVRKTHADQDGKRTPRGKRGWKSFYATLKGLVLYLQKEEYRSGQEVSQEDLKNAVSIHHSLAMRAVDYSKRANVFYLRTADWRVFLFQASSAEQMQSWITRINIVSAMFSAPPFPPAIGSQKKFSRPLLPGSNTKLSQEEQLKSHENRFGAVSSELTELIAESKVKGRDVEEQKQRQEYLEFEKTRYGTYAMLMRAKLKFATEDLSAFESRLLKEGGLQRAHSSPALPQYASLKEKGPSGRSRSLKITTTQTKEESQNGSKPDSKAENKIDVP